jgi:hypothetical protein
MLTVTSYFFSYCPIYFYLIRTAKRELFGISPSDMPISIIGFDLFRISNEGKIIEMWQQFTNGK